MLKDITACSFNFNEANQINIPNPNNWVFYPASQVSADNIYQVINDIVWPKAN